MINIDTSKSLPRRLQYPLRPEAEVGIAPIVEALLKQGTIIPTASQCNTPILRVRKLRKSTWRFVEDSRALNDCLIPTYQVVPNPIAVLSSISSISTLNLFINLCSVFFSVPKDPKSQFLFAVTYRGRQCTWMVLLQGYTKSLTLFSQALKDDLDCEE